MRCLSALGSENIEKLTHPYVGVVSALTSAKSIIYPSINEGTHLKFLNISVFVHAINGIGRDPVEVLFASEVISAPAV